MADLYKTLTDYLPQLDDIEYSKGCPEKQTGDGSMEHPFQIPYVVYNEIVDGRIDEVYRFVDAHPEYKLNRHNEILEKNHITWGDKDMTKADVSKLDGQGTMALLLAAVRAERFCDGALLDFLKKGCIQKWLRRLVELDA